MKLSLIVALMAAAASLVAASAPEKVEAKPAAKEAAAKPSVTKEAALKGGFDEKVWGNPEFDKTFVIKKTSWKIADNKVPSSWYVLERNKGERTFAVVPHADGNGSFIRISGGTLGKDLRKVGEKNTFHIRYRGKGSGYLYIIPYNKKTGSNLKSRLFHHFNNVDVKEWKDEVFEVNMPVHKDGERRVFWFVAFDNSPFEIDSIYLTTK